MPPSKGGSVGEVAFWAALIGWGLFVTGILLYVSLGFLPPRSLQNPSLPSVADQIKPLIWLLVLGSPYLCLLGTLLGIPSRKHPLGKKAIFVGGANVLLCGVLLAVDEIINRR